MSKFLLCDVPITKEDNKPYGGLNIFSPAIKQQAIDLHKLCQYYCKIRPNHKVLDFGCGTGRILKEFNNYKWTPFGFDCCWRFIEHCNDAGLLTEYLDIEHPEFNPQGSIDPHEFVLPFKNSFFDRVIGIAILNHQDIQRAQRIISETLRVVKKGGVILFTAFFINPQSIFQLRYSDRCVFKFKEKTFDWWVTDYERPYLNCALDETIIRRTIIQNRGQVIEPIYYGHWRQIVNTPTGHDLLVIRKI